MSYLKISDMKPGLVYEAPDYKIWLVVEVQRVHGLSSFKEIQYVDFRELVIGGEDVGDLDEATFTFVDGVMRGSEYDILAEGK